MGWSRPDLEMPELQTRAPPGPPRPSVASVRRLSPSWRLLPGSPHLDYPTWTTPTGGRPLAKAALRLRTCTGPPESIGALRVIIPGRMTTTGQTEAQQLRMGGIPDPQNCTL
jgi:hypothetical protein